MARRCLLSTPIRESTIAASLRSLFVSPFLTSIAGLRFAMILFSLQKPDQSTASAGQVLPASCEAAFVDFARRSMIPERRVILVRESGKEFPLEVKRTGVGRLTTARGAFWEIKFKVSDQWGEYTALVKADLDHSFMPIFRRPQGLLLRIDSGCETGQLYGDLTCDCKYQLENAESIIERKGEGLIISIPGQDGRGKGKPFKLATLFLQEELALHTVQAAECLTNGEPIDVRSYSGAIAVLKFLGCTSDFEFDLMTNNPLKLGILSENDFNFKPMPIVVPATEHTRHHLKAKQELLGHKNLIIEEPTK